MCWSLEATAVMAAAGTGGTAFAIKKNISKGIWVPLLFFTSIEYIQLVQYIVVDLCGLSVNQVFTLLAFIHIALQPIFLNMLALQFIPAAIRVKIAPYVYTLATLGSLSILLQILPVGGWGSCLAGTDLCSTQLCSVSGVWHIAWNFPLNGIFNTVVPFMGALPGHLWLFVLMVLFYGAWKFLLLFLITGPLLFRLLPLGLHTNEWPAVWCLFSITIILVFVFSKRSHALFTTKSWPLWPKH